MKVRKYEKQTREVDVVVEKYNLCDKCNKKITKSGMYDAFYCEVNYETGNEYPEGKSIKRQDVELCKDCAEELMLLLEVNGYRINKSNIDDDY